MKRRVLAVVLLTLPLFCGCALIMGSRVTGRWEGTARFAVGPLETREIVLVMVKTNGEITGSFEYLHAYGSEVMDMAGSCVGSSVEIRMMVHGLEMILEGVVERRTISGTCTYRGITDTWQVTRVD